MGGSASSTLQLKNDGSVTGYNGWLNSPVETTFSQENTSGSTRSVYTDNASNSSTRYANIMWGSTTGKSTCILLVRFSGQIILTPYNYLKVKITTSYTNRQFITRRFGVGSPSMTGNGFSSYVDLASNSSSVWYSINVSNLSGQYCIYGYMLEGTSGSTTYAAEQKNSYTRSLSYYLNVSLFR